jgi:hypothetical protein
MIHIMIVYVVAKIGYDVLEAKYPSILKKANTLLAVYGDANPAQVPNEGDYPFVECATFADEIKSHGGSW